MPEVITKAQQRVTQFWSELDKSQKVRIYIIAGILALSIAAGIYVITRVNYVPLISSDDPKELAEIKGILDDGNFKFKSENNTILIDSKSNDKAQALLVENGYPKSADSIFADAFSQISMSTTESDKRRLFIDQKQREIAAKLKMFEYIEDANVNLAIPDEPILLFSEQDLEKPTASVMVKPKEPLNKKQVNAIVMWVSKSVENLDPQDITVVDYNLNELTGNTVDELADKASSQYEMRKIWQEDLERNVRKIFNGQFESFEKIAVVANPVLDFNPYETQSKELTFPEGADGGVPISSETLKEQLENGASGGEPGVGTNPGTGTIPGYQIENSDGNSSYTKNHNITNYGYNEKVTTESKAPGTMVPEKSSMAINLLYGDRVKDEEKLFQEIEKVKQIASSATGIPIKNITVDTFKLAAEQPVEEKVSEKLREWFNTYGLFVLILLMTIALLIAVRPRKKIEEEELLEPAMAGGAPKFVIPESESEPVPDISLEERSEVKKQLDKFIKQKPDAVAQLLRNWLSDEWNG